MPSATPAPIQLTALWHHKLGPAIGQLRAAPVNLGPGQPKAFLIAWSADFDVDPYIEMFFFPTDTLKIGVMTVDGEMLWQRDLGRGIVPGLWFCPIYPFDLNGDGIDEIYFVNNTNPAHQLTEHHRVLEALDARTGTTTGQWPWVMKQKLDLGAQFMGMMFRNFIAGGHVDGQPVLVTANGTYGDMYLRAFDPGMKPRWEHLIAKEAPGARGSHYCPIVDLDGQGRDVIFWGERAINLADGQQRFCADQATYAGHSDIIEPVWLENEKSWRIFTCRESDAKSAPRLCAYDRHGQRVWGHLDHGHMDMGWAARLGPDRLPIVNGIRIGKKVCGPDGRFHENPEEFTYTAADGQALTLPFSTYRTLPVDLNGDGAHEFVRGLPSGNGEVLDGQGRLIGNVGGATALACHLGPWPGEQLLAYSPDGTLSLWRDTAATDTPAALARYAHPYYANAARASAVGYQLCLLGGL